MKKISYIKIVIASLLAITFSSCLKDDQYVDFGTAGSVVELPAAAYATGVFQPATFTVATTPTNLPLMVNFAGPKAPSAPITVTLSIDQASLDAYNKANGTSFLLLPPADYSIPSLKVTIPAGQSAAYLNIAVNTSLIDLSKQYALPLTITDGGGQTISGNYKSVIFAILVKNKYDGIYTVTGTMVDKTSAALTGDYPHTYYLQTQGATADALFDPKSSNYQHTILSSGSLSSYGSFAPVFNFDANGNVVSVINYYGQPAGNTRSAKLDPTGQNKFISGTPGTKGAVFQVSYILNQTNSIGDRTFFNETYTYVGPRP